MVRTDVVDHFEYICSELNADAAKIKWSLIMAETKFGKMAKVNSSPNIF